MSIDLTYFFSQYTGEEIEELLGKIGTNETNISSLTSTVSGHTSSISTLESNVSSLQSSVSTNTSNISTNTSNISTNSSNIGSLSSTVSSHTSSISSLESAVDVDTTEIDLAPQIAINDDTVQVRIKKIKLAIDDVTGKIKIVASDNYGDWDTGIEGCV